MQKNDLNKIRNWRVYDMKLVKFYNPYSPSLFRTVVYIDFNGGLYKLWWKSMYSVWRNKLRNSV